MRIIFPFNSLFLTASESGFDKFQPPLGMPTVFDDSFQGVGQRTGLEIWRVEQLKVVKKTTSDHAYQGQLFQGDSYIILNTKVIFSAFFKKIY